MTTMNNGLIKKQESLSSTTSTTPNVTVNLTTGGKGNEVNAFVNKQVINYKPTININDDGVSNAAKFVGNGITAKKEQFNKTFTKIDEEIWLKVPSTSSLNLYVLRYENREFCKDKLTKFIKSNFANYLCTRTRLKKYIDDDDVSSMLSDAKEILNKSPEINKENLFEEIMIYSFLECALGAPKIMTSYQLSKEKVNSQCSTIHLLPLPGSIQLVFGTSNAYGSLMQTIDESFDQALRIKENKAIEAQIYDDAVDDTGFADTDIQKLVASIMPSEASTSAKKESAFGMFLSYTVDTTSFEEVGNDDYEEKLMEKVKSDILSIQDYIENKIKALKLTGYPFYVYILPLNDVEKEKHQLIKDALGEI